MSSQPFEKLLRYLAEASEISVGNIELRAAARASDAARDAIEILRSRLEEWVEQECTARLANLIRRSRHGGHLSPLRSSVTAALRQKDRH